MNKMLRDEYKRLLNEIKDIEIHLSKLKGIYGKMLNKQENLEIRVMDVVDELGLYERKDRLGNYEFSSDEEFEMYYNVKEKLDEFDRKRSKLWNYMFELQERINKTRAEGTKEIHKKIEESCTDHSFVYHIGWYKGPTKVDREIANYRRFKCIECGRNLRTDKSDYPKTERDNWENKFKIGYVESYSPIKLEYKLTILNPADIVDYNNGYSYDEVRKFYLDINLKTDEDDVKGLVKAKYN